jgi:RNA polymerase sigma factor (sigma-70 family)
MWRVSRGDALRHPPDERQHRFEEIYEANQGPILAYLLRRTDNPSDAADVMAETFLTAWRRLGAVPDGDASRLWLYGVARRLLANHHRAERRRSALGERLGIELAAAMPLGSLGPLGLAETGGEEIAEAFRALGDRDRELLALVGWEGLDHAQIAVVLDCSRNAVRIRLHRARRRFATELERHRAVGHRSPARVTNGDPA